VDKLVISILIQAGNPVRVHQFVKHLSEDNDPKSMLATGRSGGGRSPLGTGRRFFLVFRNSQS
jgi:hypothetical protein